MAAERAAGVPVYSIPPVLSVYERPNVRGVRMLSDAAG